MLATIFSILGPIVILSIMPVILYCFASGNWPWNWKSSLAKIKREKQFSIFGYNIIKKFEALPESHRPSTDMVDVIRNLDSHYEISRVNNHFESLAHSIRCRDDNTCPMTEYTLLQNEITKLEKSIKAKELALTKAAIDSDAVGAMMDSLRNERNITDEIVKELI